MKIDIHAHTKKTKKGDAETRNIDAKRFCEIVTSSEVEIVAITNHNVFDLSQYTAFCNEAGDDIQIWPGVELDISEDGQRSHLLVIVSPQRAKDLSERLKKLGSDKSPDIFDIPIEDVVSNFDNLNPIYVVHYHQKKPDLSDESIETIIENTKNKSRVLKEVTTSISAGIYISHGHNSIYGSDIQDWNKYESQAKDLPELRLPVKTFEHFCLLLDKDSKTINTFLDKKALESLVIQPFEDDTTLELKVYNDINVFFGSKGTGKSKILEAIAKHYKKIGISTDVFESGSDKLDLLYDLKGTSFSIDLTDYDIDYCTTPIDLIKNANELDVTNLSSYLQFFTAETKNKHAQKIKIKDYSMSNDQIFERKFKSVDGTYLKIGQFIDFIKEDNTLKEIVSKKTLSALEEIVEAVISEIELNREQCFIDFKINQLFNSLIKKVKLEISRKTGTPEKPPTTGFQDYALNRIEIEVNAKKIQSNINKSIDAQKKYVGSLGEKGDLYCRTEIVVQDGAMTDASFNSISSVTKKPQKIFSKTIKEVIECLYTHNLFEKIVDLNSIENIDSITSLHELVLFKRYFTIDDNPYKPSNGEISMLLLHKELNENKDIYILDEPEKSLGSDYINDVIVPLIKDKAKVGKKVFISTHDANIAVRTLPYNSIYREHRKDGYETFVGNPFSNNLVNINNPSEEIDWKIISLKTLEGGKEAFRERGNIYGNV